MAARTRAALACQVVITAFALLGVAGMLAIRAGVGAGWLADIPVAYAGAAAAGVAVAFGLTGSLFAYLAGGERRRS